jgi:hypothetical protein
LKHLLSILVVFLSALCCAQTFSGKVTLKGNVSAGTLANYAPLTYSARTDNCVTGSESGCIGGRTTGEAGSAMSFTGTNTNTVPFADISTGNSNANSTASDPDFGAYMVMATDESTASTCGLSGSSYAHSFNMGDSGSGRYISQDGKLLLAQDQNGDYCILQLNPTSIHNKTCASITCVAATSVSSVNFFSGAKGYTFSLVSGETNVIYTVIAVASGQDVQVNRNVICLASTDPNGCSSQGSFPSVITTAYADFRNTNTSVCGTNLTQAGSNGNTTAFSGPGGDTWMSVVTGGTDGTVAFATGGALDWQASWTPTVTQSFILPTVNNAGKYAFQATTVSGPTSSTEPSWCQSSGCTTTDGSVTWTNIGTLGGQGPGFTIFLYSGTSGKCTMINTRTGYQYSSS